MPENRNNAPSPDDHGELDWVLNFVLSSAVMVECLILGIVTALWKITCEVWHALRGAETGRTDHGDVEIGSGISGEERARTAAGGASQPLFPRDPPRPR